MTLTKARRNEIAWLCVVELARMKPVRSIEVSAESISNEFGIRNDTLLHQFVTAVYRELLQITFPGLVTMVPVEAPQSQLNLFAWHLLVKKIYTEGVKFGKRSRREIGSEAKRIGITTDEMFNFHQLIAQAIFDLTFPPN